MLQRVLEPEAMDSEEEARDYDAMDHSEVNRVFASDFLRIWNGENPILDVGTGTAQIPIELCRQSPSARVVALDLAWHMLELGKKNVARARLADRIDLRHGDAKRMPFADESFAAVISNSIIHHIPEPAVVIREIVRVVRAGGVIFVRDLLRPQSEEELERLVTRYAGDANAHQQKLFADSLRAALTLDEMRALVARAGCGLGEIRQTTDRHWTWVATKLH